MKHLLLLLLAASSAHAQNWSDVALQGSFSAPPDDTPFIISSAHQLAYLAVAVNDPVTYAQFADKHYQLGTNIDLEGRDWNVSIGTSDERPFTGKFDGNAIKIFWRV